MNGRPKDDGALRPSTRIALLFAAASIALFHGYNAYIAWSDRRSRARPQRIAGT